MNRIVVSSTVLVSLFCLPIAASAQDTVLSAGNVTLSGGVGMLRLHAEEIVYLDAGDPTVLSLLRWDSLSPVLTTQMDVDLSGGWTFRGQAQMSAGGLGYMEDYDWIDPKSYDFDGWSDRSQHPGTRLEWYFNGSVLVGQDVVLNDGMAFNVNAGLKYTYARWTAFGGDVVYSSTSDSPRDVVGSIPDDVKFITYQQSFPAIIAGVDTSIERGGWTFDMSAHAGLTFLASDVDNHWLRIDDGGPDGLRFEERFVSAPLVSLAGKATYAVSDNVNVFVGASWEQIFTARGDTDIYAEHDDEPLGSYPDSAGANLGSVSITAGLTGTF